MNRLVSWALLLSGLIAAPLAFAADKPNIVLIYADDIGYGDLGCYGATEVQTPNVDQLAKEGLRFTSGYCSSSTCTPSRYSLLTGEYAFRKKGTGILPGDAALIIPTDRATLPSIMQQAGYRTGVVGKWHLGLGASGEKINWNGAIKPGPLEVGFNYSYILAATGDRVPCVYIENQHVVGLDPKDPIRVDYKNSFPGEPTGVTDRSKLVMDWAVGHNMAVVNGIGRIGYMTGGKSALWNDEEMADLVTKKSVEFIKESKDKPFFLYFATHDIHVPRVPHPRFVGKTKMGPRGDALVQFDWCVGEIMKTLAELKLTDNTMVIISSDNGPVVGDGYKDQAQERLGAHKPAGPWRGGKYSAFEGGTRVPFIVRWPAKVKPGVSEAMVSQVDLCATFAELTGQKIQNGAAPDSKNVLPALIGASSNAREYVLEHSGRVAVRVGNWKLIPADAKNAKGGNVQLFDLNKDPSESENVAAKNPEVVARLQGILENEKATPPRDGK